MDIIHFVALLTLLIVVSDSGNFTEDNCVGTVLDECLQTNTSVTTQEKCSLLQDQLDCLSVPRCLGTSLQSHRLGLLHAAIESKKTSECAALEFTQLEELIKGDGRGCSTGKDVVEDICGRRCSCANGTITDRARVRKEFTSMNFKERYRFINTYKKAVTHPRYRAEFERILNIHRNMDSHLLHHTSKIFLPWHRWYVLQIENLLQTLDCRVTVPYWDWSKNSKTWWKASDIHGIWCPGPHCLGGDGSKDDDHCVQDGPFRKQVWNITHSAGGGCLKRNFAKYIALGDHDAVKMILSMPISFFRVFEWIVREKFHNDLHDGVAGTMASHVTSSNAPEFWLHHSFLDKLWYNWQSTVANYKHHYHSWSQNKMTFSGLFPWQLLDSNNLPGGMKVVYDELIYEDILHR